MESDEHRELADDLEREAEDMQKASDRLGGRVSDVRDDWKQKQQDPGVPGAEDEPGDGQGATESSAR
jgi:hypothetical protein